VQEAISAAAAHSHHRERDKGLSCKDIPRPSQFRSEDVSRERSKRSAPILARVPASNLDIGFTLCQPEDHAFAASTNHRWGRLLRHPARDWIQVK